MVKDETLVTRTSELRKRLEEAIAVSQEFLNGDVVEKNRQQIRQFQNTKEYKELLEAAEMLSFYRFALQDNTLVKLKEVAFLSVVTDTFLNVLEKHKITPTEGMIVKVLESASYQQWQTIKKDGWGKNENRVCL